MKKTWWTMLLLFIAVAGMVLQAIQTIWIKETPPLHMVSYFSIQANLLVIIYYTAALSPRRTFWNNSSFRGATLVYITVMAIVYQTALHEGYRETAAGYGFYANIILHDINPLLFVIDWFTSRERYSYTHIIKWLSYPLLYLLYLLTLGSITDWYPYPLLSLTKLSVFVLTIHALFLLFFIALVALFYVWISQLLNLFAKRKSSDSSARM